MGDREVKIESENKVKGCQMVKVKADKYYQIDRQIKRGIAGESKEELEEELKGGVKKLLNLTKWKGDRWIDRKRYR